MRNPKGTTDQLFKSLAEYNPTTNEAMSKIAKVLVPLGIAILGILFMIELANTQKKFQSEDGGLTIELLTNIALKYVIAYVCIMGSGYIIDGIVWFTIQAAKWINSIVTATGTSEAIPQMEKVSWWAKPIVFFFQIFAYIALVLSSIIANILIFLRGIKRLEEGQFIWPAVRDGKVSITRSQLAMLLDKLDWRQPKTFRLNSLTML